MFNLDQAISEWRRQMLAVGIKTPVPLEELESHLREEIEEHINSGVNEAEAFRAAAEKIGLADQLRYQFKKVEKDNTIIRAILLAIGWLVAGCMLTYGIAGWDLDWNLFHFSPRWKMGVVVELLGILVALFAMWFLARASRDKMSRVLSMLVCVYLGWFSIQALQPEKIKSIPIPVVDSKTTDGQAVAAYMKYRIESALSRSQPSPFWYRGSQMLALALPAIFLVGWILRDLARNRSATHGAN